MRLAEALGFGGIAMLLMVLVVLLSFIIIAGVGFALAGPGGGDAKVSKRAQTMVGKDARGGQPPPSVRKSQEKRRKQILQTLRDQDRQQKKATLSISAKLQQSGLGMSVRDLLDRQRRAGGRSCSAWSCCFGQSLLIALGLAFAAGLACRAGSSAWWPGRGSRSSPRAFPDAMDIIVRGIRSGLPVHDSLRVIATKPPSTLAGQFHRLVESIGMGVSGRPGPGEDARADADAGGAVLRHRAGHPAEDRRQPGRGPGNLSTVIRARKLMREKIKALSGEAVASAFIIGSLPPAVAGLINITAPGYMMPLFTDPRGHVDADGRRVLDEPWHLHDAQDDQFQDVGRSQNMISALTNPDNSLAAFVAIVCFATIVSITSPMFNRSNLETRLKSVSTRREELRRKSREAMASRTAGRTACATATRGCTRTSWSACSFPGCWRIQGRGEAGPGRLPRTAARSPPSTSSASCCRSSSRS